MKQNKLKILIIIMLFFMDISNVYADSLNDYVNEETKYKVILEDDAFLLTANELEKLKKKMIPLTEYGHVLFKTTNSNSTFTHQYAETVYSEKFGNQSGTMFLIDMSKREIYIYSAGANYNVITKEKAYIITDNVYKLATGKKYYKCAKKAFSQIHTLLEGKPIIEPMKYISNVLISVTTSFLLTYIVILTTTKIRKTNEKKLLKNCNVLFDVKDIKVKKTGTHKEYNPRTSSSSGGLSGGGRSFGGGGRSSGGGGGHRF